MTDNKLVVVIPYYNESDAIKTVVDEWSQVLNELKIDYSLLILNDGSTDNSLHVLNEMSKSYRNLEVINKVNSGHGQTCLYGYKIALDKEAEWIFQIDSDGQCDPKYFYQFWERRSEFPAIFGRRIKREDGFFRKCVSYVTKLTVSIMTFVKVYDPNVPYRLISAEVLKKVIVNFPMNFKLVNILLYVITKKGLNDKVLHIGIGFRKRIGGKPTVKLFKFLSEALMLIKQLFQNKKFINEKSNSLAETLN